MNGEVQFQEQWQTQQRVPKKGWVDENEREGGPTDCRMDTIRSAGPNGILYDSDDQGYVIPFSRPCP